MRVGRARTFPTGGVSRGFSFSLEPLLVLRKARETEAAFELARAQRDLERAQNGLRELEAGMAGALGEIARTGATRVGEFEVAAAAVRRSIARFEEGVGEAKAALSDAMRDRKAVEALKERRQAEFEAEEARKEERELDEANHR